VANGFLRKKPLAATAAPAYNCTMRERLLTILAFAAIHVVWGTTYLAIHYAVQTIPPLLTAGLRHLLGGAALFAVCWSRGLRPTARQWRASAVAGFLFFLIGHGSLHWAELYVASGAAALFVATEPVWVAVLSALTERDARLSPAAMSLLCGGAQLIAAAALSGSLRFFDVARVTAASAAGLAYLVVLGSVTFAGYVWLLTRCSPVLIATHTYTNPLIAVLLGAAIAGERLTPRMAVAGAAILLAIALVRRATPSTYLDHDETIARDPDPLRDRSTRAVHAAAGDGRPA